MGFILDSVLLCSVDDEDRFRLIIDNMIKKKEIKKFKVDKIQDILSSALLSSKFSVLQNDFLKNFPWFVGDYGFFSCFPRRCELFIKPRYRGTMFYLKDVNDIFVYVHLIFQKTWAEPGNPSLFLIF